MGDHKNNPIAITHQAPKPPLPEFAYGYAFEVVIEPNAKKKAEMQAFLDSELLAGKGPGEINTQFEITPEDQDYVVYHQPQVAKPSRIAQQIPVAKIRGPEHFRMPLTELLNRAKQAFDGGPSDAKA